MNKAAPIREHPMRASRRDVLIGVASSKNPPWHDPAIAAEKYPVRPVRLISGFPAGGAVDITARVLADWMSSDLGQQVYVEDRGGSGGNIGAQAAITSPPDGYTVMFVAPNNAIGESLYKKLPFNFRRDTVPVARHHAAHQHHGRSALDAVEDGRRVHRLRQGEPRQAELRIVRQRHLGAHVGRAVQGDDRGRHACMYRTAAPPGPIPIS